VIEPPPELRRCCEVLDGLFPLAVGERLDATSYLLPDL
jgi:hypothetical protein